MNAEEFDRLAISAMDIYRALVKHSYFDLELCLNSNGGWLACIKSRVDEKNKYPFRGEGATPTYAILGLESDLKKAAQNAIRDHSLEIGKLANLMGIGS